MNRKKISVLFLGLILIVLFIVLLKFLDQNNETINNSDVATNITDETHTVAVEPEPETNSASTPSTTAASPTPSVVVTENHAQSSEISSPQTSDDVSSAYNEALVAYNSFLEGSINAQDLKQAISDGLVNIKEISLEPDLKTYYALFDMNGDGIPELHLRPASGGSYLIFTYLDGKIVLWHNGTDYESPLNNSAILYERDGAAPTHINYSYLVLDSEGNEVLKVSFSKYHSVDKSGLNESTDYDQFIFENKEVTEDEWNSLTKEYLSASSDLIQWKEIE